MLCMVGHYSIGSEYVRAREEVLAKKGKDCVESVALLGGLADGI